ncbi:MAG TPA: flagellar motor protein MotB, partial [Chitinophagaceae bacterium]
MKRLPFILYLLFFVFHFSFVSAQPYDPGKINKKAVQLYNQAMERANDGNLTFAVGLLQQSIETDNKYVDAYLALASVYSQLKNYKNSADNYEKAFVLDTAYTIDHKLSYSIQLAGMGKFENALNAVNELLQKKPPKNETSFQNCLYRKRCYEFAVDYAKKNAGKIYVFELKNLGKGINTAESE